MYLNSQKRSLRKHKKFAVNTPAYMRVMKTKAVLLWKLHKAGYTIGELSLMFKITTQRIWSIYKSLTEVDVMKYNGLFKKIFCKDEKLDVVSRNTSQNNNQHLENKNKGGDNYD